MAIAVVQRTPIGIGEDLVGLGGLLELLLRVGGVGVDVGVQLARERAKRLLYLLLGGVARESENLVWVARHARLVSSRHTRVPRISKARVRPRGRSRSRPRNPSARGRSPRLRRACAAPFR